MGVGGRATTQMFDIVCTLLAAMEARAPASAKTNGIVH